MSKQSRVNSNEIPSASRPSAHSSALGFLSRSIQSVSSFVSNISTAFSQLAATAELYEEEPEAGSSSQLETEAGSEVDSTGTHQGTSQARYGSPAEEGPGIQARILEVDMDDRQDGWEDTEPPVGPDVIAARSAAPAPLPPDVGLPAPESLPFDFLARIRRSPGLAAPPPAFVPAADVVPPPRQPRRRIRREGAFYGSQNLPSTAGPSSAAGRAPRRRGQLRREQVYIEGMDPSEINPASELRGRDPRFDQEHAHWHEERWGPPPTLEDIAPGVQRPRVRMILGYLERRYGHGTQAYWAAVDHLFANHPTGSQPHFRRIVPTSQWRIQAEDWMGGIEPVDRVREPARADDAADSEAEIESIGYISDDDDNRTMVGVEATEPEPGPSSMALVLARPARSPSRAASSSSRALVPRNWEMSSPGAGPSTPRPAHGQKRSRDSDNDAEQSTISTAEDPEARRIRRRLSPPEPAMGSSSMSGHRLASHGRWLAPRNASFRVPSLLSREMRDASTQTSPRLVGMSVRSGHYIAPRVPRIAPTPAPTTPRSENTSTALSSTSGSAAASDSAAAPGPSDRVVRVPKRTRDSDGGPSEAGGDDEGPSEGGRRDGKRPRKE